MRPSMAVGLIAAGLALSSCGADRSGENFGGEVYDAWNSGEPDALVALIGPNVTERQREAIGTTMDRCEGVDDTTRVIDGDVSVNAKFAAFELDCAGTRSLFFARIYLDSDGEQAWSLDGNDLPGGKGAVPPGVDLGPLAGLPRAW